MNRQEENVVLIREGFADFERRDLEALLARLDPEVEVFSTPKLANSGTFHGHEGYLKWVGDWLEAWDEFKIEVQRVAPVGDRHVVTAVRQTGRGRGSGVPVEMKAAYMLEIRDRKLVRFHMYSTLEEALEAARRGEAG
jgi:ketosteroid isomerase-like protein